MSYTVTVNNTVFTLPDPGDPPNYAEELKSFFQEVAAVLNSQSGALDIIETDFNFNNNVSSPTDVQGFNVVTSNIASFIGEYLIKRVSGGTTITESGQLYGRQGAGGWSLAVGDITSDSTLFDGFSGVDFTITTAGQLQYVSTNFVGQTQGLMTFKMKAIQQD